MDVGQRRLLLDTWGDEEDGIPDGRHVQFFTSGCGSFARRMLETSLPRLGSNLQFGLRACVLYNLKSITTLWKNSRAVSSS